MLSQLICNEWQIKTHAGTGKLQAKSHVMWVGWTCVWTAGRSSWNTYCCDQYSAGKAQHSFVKGEGSAAGVGGPS